MSVIESIIYGFVSGLTEFLPVSSIGHQALMLQLFGLDSREPIRDLLVHLAALIALLLAGRPLFQRLRRVQSLPARRRSKAVSERNVFFELRLIKTAAVPMIAGFLLYTTTRSLESKPIYLCLFFALNGVVLLFPEYMRHGNKDARFLTGLDAILMGLFGALSALPGISRVGFMNAYALSRGADRQKITNWLLAVSVPALFLLTAFDIYHLFVIPIGAISFLTVIGYVISGMLSFCGTYLGINLLRFMTVHVGFGGFAYYSFGAAIFSFVLYLIT